MAHDTAGTSRRRLWTWIAAAVALPFVLFGAISWRERSEIFGHAALAAQNSATIAYEHANKVFETHRLALDLIDWRVRGMSWEEIEKDRDLHAMLAEMSKKHEQILSIWLEDATGTVRASSENFPTGMNVSDRDYFIAQRDGDQGLFVSRPYFGRVTRKDIYAVSHRRTSKAGAFDGAIHIAVRSDYFQKFWNDIQPYSKQAISMRRADGVLLVRYPEVDILQSKADPEAMEELKAAGSDVLWRRSPLDGVERVIAVRKVDRLPIYVTFGIDTDVLWALWYRELFSAGVYWLLATAALVGAVLYGYRRLQREKLAVLGWQETAQKLEREIEVREAAEASLRQSQKLEAIGQITGGVAHDFNNLLQAMAASLHLIDRKLMERDRSLAPHLDTLTQAVERGTRMTRHLVAFARRQRLKAEPVDVNALVSGSAPIIERAMGGICRVEIAPAAQAWNAMVDATQLELALLNLAINARDAMPAGGTLTIDVHNEAIGPAAAGEVEDLATGDYVVISVIDTGCGMAKDVAGRAFEPFFTTKEVGKGSGLGLSMVHGFVRQSGGAVHLESWPGIGTRVDLYLPRTLERPETVPPPEPVPDDRQAVAVLLVDDDSLVRSAMAMTLRNFGHTVIEAASGAEALARFEAGAQVDLVITDRAMPGMDGLELFHRIRRRRPDLPVILITGNSESLDDAEWDLSVLHKPFQPAALDAAVRAALIGAEMPQAPGTLGPVG